MKKILFLFLILHCTLHIDNCFSQWVQVNNGMGNRTVYSLATSGNNIFAGTDFNGGVHLSTNNGTSWTQTSLIQNIFGLAVNTNYVFAGTQSNGVYLSANNGNTWSQTSLGNRWVTALAANGNYVFAGVYSPDGLYLSPNNGTSWTQTSLINRSVRSLAVTGNNIFAGTYTYGVYLSTNNGSSWIQTSLNNRTVYSIAINGNDIFAGTDLGVYLSANNGTTWTQTALNNVSVLSLAVSGNNIFAGTYGSGAYISNNYGASWTQRNEGLSNFCLISLCILNNYIFAGTFCEMPRGVYRRPLSELVGIVPISNEIPNQFSLSQNYPNPFNPTTNVQFSIVNVQYVTLKIFDLLGREVATLVNEQLQPGTYEVDWDGSGFASGVYYYKLVAGDYTETRKMVLMK